MAGEIQLNSTTMATESSGTITLSNVNSATNRTNLGLGSMATQNANAVAITGGTINAVAITGGTISTVQPATGQSLTIKDEDGNTAITIGTDNTAASYLSLNFGSYHGDSGGAGSGSLSANTLDDYEEGTFSFSVRSATTSGTGYYTKIGDICHINMAFNGTAGTLPDNNMYLPFSHSGAEFTVGDSSFPLVNGSVAYGLVSSGSNTISLADPVVGNNQSVLFKFSFVIRVN